jgi:hypothetical protein
MLIKRLNIQKKTIFESKSLRSCKKFKEKFNLDVEKSLFISCIVGSFESILLGAINDPSKNSPIIDDAHFYII